MVLGCNGFWVFRMKRIGFGSFVHHTTHSISHPSSSFRGISKRWGGFSPPPHVLGSNPATWSPVPLHNPVIAQPARGFLSLSVPNPFSALKKKIESVIPSSDPQRLPSKTPKVGQEPSILANPLVWLGVGIGSYFILKK
jgi:hypothetical protein